MYVHAIYIEKCTLNNFIFSTHPPPLLAGRVGLEYMMKRKKMPLLENKNTIYLLSYSLARMNQNPPNTRTTASRTLPPFPAHYPCIIRLPEPLPYFTAQSCDRFQ